MGHRILNGRWFQEVIAGRGYPSTVPFSRTADAAPYTAGDVIGVNAAGSPGSAIHTFAGMGPTGGNIQLTTASLTINLTAVPVGMTTFLLHLYVAPPAAILDNAAFSAAAADRAFYRGSIPIPAFNVIGGGFLHIATDYIGRHIKLIDANLYGVLQTLGGYTPVSANEIIIRLNSGEIGP